MASDLEIAQAAIFGIPVIATAEHALVEAIASALATARAEGHAAGVAQAATAVEISAGVNSLPFAEMIRALTTAPAAPPRAETEA